jgi:hypothetical protein
MDPRHKGEDDVQESGWVIKLEPLRAPTFHVAPTARLTH